MSRRSTTRHVADKAMPYLTPWMLWPALLPIGGTTWILAEAGGTPGAVAIGGAVVTGGCALTAKTWAAFARREDPAVQLEATVTTGIAATWIAATTAFGLFQMPDVPVWPLHTWFLDLFNAPIWGSWIMSGIGAAAWWNINRAGFKPKQENDGERRQQPIESELTKVLDGAKLIVDSTVSENGAITAELKGVPGKHTHKTLAGMAAGIESAHELRAGAVIPIPDPGNVTRIKLRVMPTDPHKDAVPWPGPAFPGTSITEHPHPLGPHTDGVIATDWMCGDPATSRPVMHVRVGGVNNSGKSAGWRIPIADAMTRDDFEFVAAADISGKIFQTFGPFLPYVPKIAGTNGVDDDGIAANLRDTVALLEWLERDTMERQQRWGALGFEQWSREVFEATGDKFGAVVLEEADEIMEQHSDLVFRIAKKVRSGGRRLFIVTQRWAATMVDTNIRAQMPGVFCFGQDSSRDVAMMLPEDVCDMLAEGSGGPGSWRNEIPGKAIVITAGQARERRVDPVRFFKASGTEIGTALAAAGVQPVRTEADVQAMLGVHVQADVHGDAVHVQPDVRTESDVHVQRDVQEDDLDADVPYGDVDEEIVYRGVDRPVQSPMYDDVRGGDVPPLPLAEFRTVVQRHLTALLAQGRTETTPADVAAMRPATGRKRQEIRNELVRLATAAAKDEVSVVCPEDDGGSGKTGVYRLVAPQEVPKSLSVV